MKKSNEDEKIALEVAKRSAEAKAAEFEKQIASLLDKMNNATADGGDNMEVDDNDEAMTYLRREKEFAEAKCETLAADRDKWTRDCEKAWKDLKEANDALSKVKTTAMNDNEHKVLLAKLEKMSQVDAENASLKISVEQLQKDGIAKVEKLSKELNDAKDKAMKATAFAESKTAELNAIKAEALRWEERANKIVDASNLVEKDDFEKVKKENDEQGDKLIKMRKQLDLALKTLKTINPDRLQISEWTKKHEDELERLRKLEAEKIEAEKSAEEAEDKLVELETAKEALEKDKAELEAKVKAFETAKPSPAVMTSLFNNDFDFDIREDTECIPNINEIKNSHVFQSKGFGSPIAVLKERSVSDTDGNNDAEAPRPARQKSSLNNNTVISTNINNNNTLNENRPSTTNNERTVLTAVPAVNDNEIQLIDPFANIDSLLSAISIESCVNVSLSSDPNELSVLLAAGKRVSGARGAVGKKPGEGIEVSLGNKTYVLRSKAGEGAYAQVYEAEGEELEIEDDENAAAARRSSLETLPVYAIKVESKKLASWEYTISKRLCERLPRGAPRDVVVPSHLRLLFDGNTSTHTTGALVMKFGDHGTLQDVINFYKLTDSKNGTMDERLAMYYSIELLRLLEWTHECDVLHCDVKPDNLLIRNGGERWMDWDSIRTGSWKKKGLALIDFGRAIDLRDYPNTTYFIGDAGTEAFSCPEMRKKNEPWLFQADLFAIAATIHVLLHGEYMDTIEDKNTGKYVPKLAFKRYWNQDVWKLVFGKLMNHPLTSKEEKPNLREIREVLEKALTESSSGGSILKQLLVKQTIGMFELIKEGKAI